MSTISWTSPSDSAYGLPISRVTSARERLLVVLDEPADLLDRAAADRRRAPRAHARCAARAARQASTNVAASPRRTSATTSSVFAGLRRGQRSRPGASVTACPLTIEATVRVAGAVVDMEPTVSARVTSPAVDRSLIVVGAGVFGASLARQCARAGLGRHARRARRARPRARRVGRRVADHPLRARRGRVARGLGAPGLGAVARDRPGARRPVGRALARPPRRRLGGRERAHAARRSASRARGIDPAELLPELRRRRHRVGPVGARGRRPARARRDEGARRAGGRRRAPSSCSPRRGRTAPRSCSTTAAGSRPTASSGRAARGCRALFARPRRPAHHPAGRLLLRRERGVAHARRPDVGRLRRRRLRRRRRRRARREGLLGPRGPGRLRPRRRPRARCPSTSAARARSSPATSRRSRDAPLDRHARLPVRADGGHALPRRAAPRARRPRVAARRRLGPRLQARARRWPSGSRPGWRATSRPTRASPSAPASPTARCARPAPADRPGVSRASGASRRPAGTARSRARTACGRGRGARCSSRRTRFARVSRMPTSSARGEERVGDVGAVGDPQRGADLAVGLGDEQLALGQAGAVELREAAQGDRVVVAARGGW